MSVKSFARMPVSRLVVGIASSIYLFVLIVMMWRLPSFPLELTWQPDLQLLIVATGDGSDSADSPQPQDIILAIDGKLVERLAPIFNENKPFYDLLVLRDGEEKTVIMEVDTNETALNDERFPLTYLSVMLWLCGIAMIALRKPSPRINLLCGYTFILLALGLLSVRLAFTGIVNTWIIGHTFGFLAGAGLIIISLQFESRDNATLDNVSKVLMGIATLFALVGLGEAALLYPTASIQMLIGVSWISLNILGFALGLLVHYLILAIRYFLSQDVFLKRQIRTLLYFVTLSSIPILMVLLLPQRFFYSALEIQHIGFIFFSLVPLGYIYTINRAYHQIDSIFVDLAVVSSIAIILWVIYGIGHLITFNRSPIGPAGNLVLFLMPFLLLVPTLGNRLRAVIERIVYGKEQLEKKHIEDFSNQLALAPDLGTVDSILKEIKETMRLEHIVLLLMPSESWVQPAHANETIVWLKDDSVGVEDMPANRPILRQTDADDFQIFSHYPWSACAVQLSARNRVIGSLLMSYSSNEPYFNPNQVGNISLLSRIIAVGYETISLFETSLNLNIQLQQVREQERRLLASEIHDVPLQDLTMVSGSISLYKDSKDEAYLKNALDWLNSTTTTLRRICVDLHPPEIELGLELALREAINRFRRKGTKLQVNLTVEDDALTVANQQTSTAIFHVVFEALNNIVKHSNATEADIALRYQDSNAILTIQDNGGPAELLSVSNVELLRNNHIGLISMQQWAKLVQGHLSVRSFRDQGVRVEFTMPVQIASLNDI